MRVADVLEAVPGENVTLIGRGMGALLALYAAALHQRVVRVGCDGGLLSHRMLAESGRHLHGANVIVRGVLEHFDLPALAELLRPRRVMLRGPVDAMTRPIPESAVGSVYGPAVRVVSASTSSELCLSFS